MSNQEDVIGNIIEAMTKFERIVICHPDLEAELKAGIEKETQLGKFVTIIPSELVPRGTAYIMPKHQLSIKV